MKKYIKNKNNGMPVCDVINGGTYDYFTPSSIDGLMNHLEYDLYPYYEYGNAPSDPTTKEQRRNAVGSNLTGKAGNTILNIRQENVLKDYMIEQTKKEWSKILLNGKNK